MRIYNSGSYGDYLDQHSTAAMNVFPSLNPFTWLKNKRLEREAEAERKLNEQRWVYFLSHLPETVTEYRTYEF